MDKDSEKWIEADLNEAEETGNAEFQGEVFLSTDGKHTVFIKASTKEGRKVALAWAQSVYDHIVQKYGTKQQANVKAYTNPPTVKETQVDQDLGNCEKCGAPNKLSKAGKVYCSALCWKKG